VIADWKKVKKIKDYELVVGTILFQNLFEKCPQAKPLFGFPLDTDPRNKYLLKSPRFAQHATFLVKMVDTTVNMLKEGMTKHLTKMLTDLGKKHVAYGVMPEYFPFMTESLLVMLKETIGDVNDDAWQDVFDYLSAVMEAGHRRINKDVAAKMDKDICIKVWKRLTFMRKYKEEGGVILFQKYVCCCCCCCCCCCLCVTTPPPALAHLTHF
jgi:hemoglobin-like flavoprotein